MPSSSNAREEPGSPQSRKRVSRKNSPNILITGTPGVGKSELCKRLVERSSGGDVGLDVRWINVGDFAREHHLLGDYDEVYQCHELEEDEIVDQLESSMRPTEPGDYPTIVVDHHVTDYFPEKWFDIVFVLRTDNTILYDRLAGENGRGYEGKKLKDNLECEIFQTILDEAKESYPEELVHELPSNDDQDLSTNVERILAWISQWKRDRAVVARSTKTSSGR